MDGHYQTQKSTLEKSMPKIAISGFQLNGRLTISCDFFP